MSYSGSTASSTAANPPRIVAPMLGALFGTTGLSTAPRSNSQGGNLWVYTSTNLTTDLTASNFFTDGQDLGMSAGDIVIGAQFSSAGSSVQSFIGVITGVSSSGASLSTGSLITSTFG